MSNLISATFLKEDEKKVTELLVKLKAKFLFDIKLSLSKLLGAMQRFLIIMHLYNIV